MDCSTPGYPVHHYLPEFVQTQVHWVSGAIQLSNSLLPPSPLALNLSQYQGLSTESAPQIRNWSKYWNFSFSISPSNEYSGFISFRIDWFDLAIQGTLKNLLQHHNSKASILWRSAFFIVQLSLPYMTTGETIALTLWTFVSKALSLLFSMLSRFVIAFLPRSKRLLISWLPSSSIVILEPKKIKSATVFHFSPLLLAMKRWDQMLWSSFFECWVLSQFFYLYIYLCIICIYFYFSDNC